MAEGLLRRKLEREGRAGEFCVASAGMWTADGRPASLEAIQVMAWRGIDISAHRSRMITEEMLAEAALVLTMTRSQAEALRVEFPAYASRIHLLSELVGRSYDIDDPIGSALSNYERTAREIEDLVERGYEQIIKWICK